MGRPRQTNVLLEPVLVSPAMRKLDRTLRKVAEKDVTVCLIGESGTGKEVLARRLHELSARRAQAFVPINCAAIPEQLFESELFGHEKGAFTGAHERVLGKVEAANLGTLFLDEVGETPISMQAKLLRFLENRRFMRVGGHTKVDVDVRLICATLRPLEEEVRLGRFRADLFYRIQGITLTIPPLRERRADIAPLVHQLLAQACSKHGTRPPRLGRVIMKALERHPWPGNVRELRNVIDRLAILRGGKRVREQDVPELSLRASSGEAEAKARLGHSPALEVSLDDGLEAVIDRVIHAAVEIEGGNKSRAAERLGIGLRTVQRRYPRAV